MKEKKKITEIEKLIALLNTYHVPYGILPDCMDSNPQIWYPCRENNTCDVICNKYSYGGSKGYLEIMGLIDEKKLVILLKAG